MKLNRLFLTLAICTTCFSASIAQAPNEARHKIGEYLSVSFPGTPDSMTVSEHTLKVLNTDATSYVVTINTSGLTVKGKKDFDVAMKGVVTGYLRGERLKRFRNTIIDTVIGGSKGKYVHCFDGPEEAGFAELYSFLTIQDSYFYTVSVVARVEPFTTRDSVNAFLETIKFHGKNYPEAVYDPFKVGSTIGYYFIPVTLLILLIVFIVKRINKNNRKARNKRLTGSI